MAIADLVWILPLPLGVAGHEGSTVVVGVTADLYTHVLMPRQRAASEAADTLILGDDDPDDGQQS